jgi:hypothetical protein
MWVTIFGATNLLALGMWLVLIALPRKPAILAAVLYLGVGLLCLTYTVCVVALLGGLLPDPTGGVLPDLTTIPGIQTVFASEAGLVLGWVHYLAFDMFIGLWIARDADAKGISRYSQVPILLLTFLAGPVGLLVWLLLRERRARRLGRWQ